MNITKKGEIEMELLNKDLTQHQDYQREETDFRFRRKPARAWKDVPHLPLVAYTRVDNKWIYKEFCDENKRNINVSSDLSASDLKIAGFPENTKLVLKQLGDAWYAFDSSRQNSMHVDCFREPQALIHSGEKRILAFGNTVIVLSTKGEKAQIVPPEGAPKASEYSVELNQKQLRFNINSPCFFGSNTLCDIRIKELDHFSAMINIHGARPFLCPIADPEILPVRVKGIIIEQPTPLDQESRFSIGDYAFTFRISREVRFNDDPASFAVVPGTKNRKLVLTQLDETDFPLATREIPPPGKAVYAGRGSDCNFRMNDTNISRKHAQFLSYENGLMVLDCGSRNGTYVNGDRITKRMMHPGDILSMAGERFVLCYS